MKKNKPRPKKPKDDPRMRVYRRDGHQENWYEVPVFLLVVLVSLIVFIIKQ